MPDQKTSFDKARDMSLSEQLTYSTVQLLCLDGKGGQSTGTAFIIDICMNEEKQTCVRILVTNKHVIANKKSIIFELCLADDEGKPIDTKTFQAITSDFLWRAHPDPNVDLCCLPLAPILQNAEKQGLKPFFVSLSLEFIPSEESLKKLTALEEVIMVGYPIGLSDTYNHKPIIRKGITATHPKNDYRGKKETLLDIAAFPGSSGSPVFILNLGAYAQGNGINLGTRFLFMGVMTWIHLFDAKGELRIAELPNMPIPHTGIPTNLGIMIKSERVKEFEKLFPRPAEENKA